MPGLSVPSLAHDLLTIVARTAGIVGAVLLVGRVAGNGPWRRWLPGVSGALLAGLVLVFALGQVPDALSLLNQERQASVASEPGRDECFDEQVTDPRAVYRQRLPFVLWARRQMGPGATYATATLVPPPDDTCLDQVLLPALPARPGERPGWTIAYGSIPPAMAARIAAHDPSVRVYAPGLALESNPR